MQSDPVQVLSEIMARWPMREEEGKEFRNRMEHLLTDDVSDVDFGTRPIGTFSRFSEPLIVDNVAKIFVYDTGFAGRDRNLAVMVRGADGRWRLKAFFEQCLVCFGYQLVAGNIPCDYCGATGWGEWELWRERFGTAW